MQDHYRWLMRWLYDSGQRLYSEVPYRLSKSGRAFPAWHFFLELTRRCNLRCRMCQYIAYLENVPGAQQKEGELTAEEWKSVIRQAGPFSFLTFTGGEPLIRQDFGEILTFASHRSRTHFVSNATLINASIAELCVGLAPRHAGGRGLNFIGVSLEGPAEVHNDIRQQSQAFEKAAAGLALLNAERVQRNRKLPLVHITTVIQQGNLHTLHLMPGIVRELGADVLNLVTETRMHDLPGLGERPPGTWRSGDIDWPRIPREDLEKALEKTDEEARRLHVELRLPRMPREELLRYYSSGVDVRDYQCRSPWNTVIIGRTGDVYPCWLKKIGNVREQTLKDLWNAVQTRTFRQSCRTSLFPACPGCCFIEYCGGKGAE